jgi:excisionase family DNA binding protein
MAGLNQEFLTTRAAARRYRVSPGRLQDAIRVGDLPAYRPGKRWFRLWEPDLIAFLKRDRVCSTEGQSAKAFARRRVDEIRRGKSDGKK